MVVDLRKIVCVRWRRERDRDRERERERGGGGARQAVLCTSHILSSFHFLNPDLF